ETLTLTSGKAEVRLLQTWVRTAGTIDKTGKVLSGRVAGPEAALVKVGQRVRAFPPSSKSSMYQAYVTRVTPTPSGIAMEATLAASGRANTTLYVLEVVVEQGPYLWFPTRRLSKRATSTSSTSSRTASTSRRKCTRASRASSIHKCSKACRLTRPW